MATSTIGVPVDSETAAAFARSSLDDQRKMQLLLALRLQELTAKPVKPLKDLMDEIGQRASERGLTPTVLESLLNAR
jgi:hypothetical protein